MRIFQKYRLAVGTMGMNVFMEILDKERSNPELLTLTLETLVAVLSSDDENTDEDELGERLAEVFFFFNLKLAYIHIFRTLFSSQKHRKMLILKILKTHWIP